MKQIIKRIIIKNFRLFDEHARDFEFGGGFAQIIANNGNGKTSLWWGLKIGLTGAIPRSIGRLGDKGIIHFPERENENESKDIQKKTNAEITIILNNKKENGVRPFIFLDKEEDDIIIHTIIPPTGGIRYYVNGKKWDKKELQNILNDIFINPDDPFLFLEQNKTSYLLDGGPLGLMDALEETIDVKELRDNLDNALISYKKSKESYQESKLKMQDSEKDIKILKEEYDKFKKSEDLSKKIRESKNETLSREYSDILSKIKEFKFLEDSKSNEIKNLSNKNKDLIKNLKKIEKELEDLKIVKSEHSIQVKKLNQELRKLEKEKGRNEKALNDINSKLNEIEILKKIDKFDLLNNYKSIENKYLILNSEISKKKESFVNFETQLKFLEKGKTIDPQSLYNFIQLLNKNSINAESLINTIDLEEGFINRKNKLENIQLFESILGDYRWAVLVYGNEDDFKKSIDLAKEKYLTNLLIHIPDINEVPCPQINFKGFEFKIKNLKIKKYISSIIQDFFKSNVNLEEGLILEEYGVRLFKIDLNSLNIDKENRINTLKQQLKSLKLDIQELKKQFKDFEKKKNKLKKELDNLDIINEAPDLITNKHKIIIEQRRIDTELNNIQSKIKDLEFKINETEVDIRIKERKIGEIEGSIDTNKAVLNNSIKEKKEYLYEIKNNEENKKSYEHNFAEIIKEYPNPRDLNYLSQNLIELNKELTQLGEIDEKAVNEYKHKINAYNLLKDILFKADEDLDKKVEDVEKYQLEFKEYLDIVLKEIQKNFSKVLRIIEYDGQITRNIYRLKGRKNNLTLINEPDNYILDDETFYGINIKIKKPGDKRFNKFFDDKGKVSSRHSGGQKALVILGFLLAIQKTMGINTSFYILDEPTPQLDDINNSFILKLFSELDTQVILLTPKPMLPEFFDEIIVILNDKIKKIPRDLIDNLESLDNLESGSSLFIRKNGDAH